MLRMRLTPSSFSAPQLVPVLGHLTTAHCSHKPESSSAPSAHGCQAMGGLLTWAGSSHGWAPHMGGLLTWAGSSHGRAPHMGGLLTWACSSHGHAPHMGMLLTADVFSRVHSSVACYPAVLPAQASGFNLTILLK